MDATKMVHYWNGKRLEDLTKDELVEAVLTLQRTVDNYHSQHMAALTDIGDRLAKIRGTAE